MEKKETSSVFTLETEKGVVKILKPNRSVLKLIMTKMRTDMIGAAEVLVSNCWLEGDESLKENDGFLIGLINVLDEIVGVVAVTVKKN